MKYSQPSPPQVQPTEDRKYFLKNPKKFWKEKLEFAVNYLHNIYIVLGKYYK